MTEATKNKSKDGQNLKGKNCLLTGAASGIGRSLAILLGKEGVNLFLADLDLPNLEKVREIIAPLGVKVFATKCDVSQYEDLKKLAEQVYAQLGDIDILFNNAGIGTGGFIEQLEPEEWKRLLDINLWSVIFAIKVFLPRMLERGSGYIINTASGAGVVGLPNHIPYVTSKFAVVGLSEALYSELNHRGIDVSIICPTLVKTNLIDRSIIQLPSNVSLGNNEQERARKLEDFRKVFWDIYMRGSLTPDQAAERYMKKIKQRKLYIFDKKIVNVAMFFKAVAQSVYKKILTSKGSDYRDMYTEALTKTGLLM